MRGNLEPSRDGFAVDHPAAHDAQAVALRDAASRLAGWVESARSVVAFTGAGVSTESGIPDFRSPGGLWSRMKPVYFRDFLEDPAERARYWRFKTESRPVLLAARPNGAHHALARLEERGRLACVITQNIDGLHQAAGSRSVLELHGTDHRVTCLSCGRETPPDEAFRRFESTGDAPACATCGGWLKVATISFGQPLDPVVLDEARRRAAEADLFLAVGTSLQVVPAASLPKVALRSGARLVIVNRTETPCDDVAALVVRAAAGEFLAAALGSPPSP